MCSFRRTAPVLVNCDQVQCTSLVCCNFTFLHRDSSILVLRILCCASRYIVDPAHDEAGTNIPSAPSTSNVVIEKCKCRLSDIDLSDHPPFLNKQKYLPEVPEETKNRALRKKNSRIQSATAMMTLTCSDLETFHQ